MGYLVQGPVTVPMSAGLVTVVLRVARAARDEHRRTLDSGGPELEQGPAAESGAGLAAPESTG
ncbi:hypothetical protein ASG41_20225 [Modestobacter sp. Leaf380]|nr:hypothetical protein ASG41_20225 [Modestobacter sp. Leaf380]